MITYLDRVCIAAAAPGMMADLGLTTMQMGYAFSAFALAYGIFEAPMGWLSDRYGQRRVLTRIVACWSVFTALTGAVSGLWTLLGVRFVFGAAEAGAFPTLARALSRWFPARSRAAVNGAMWMGARFGGAVAPAIAAWLIGRTGWRWAFAVFGSLGLFWCVAFWNWFRDDPATHPGVNRAELDLIQDGSQPRPGNAGTPWRALLTSGNAWALFGMYFSASFGFYFLVTWLPSFLIREHGLSLQTSGFYAVLPLGAASAACLTGGWLADWLSQKTGSVRRGRAAVGVAGFVLGSAGFAAASAATGPLAAVLCLAGAQAALDLTVGVSWATCVDVGGRFGSTLAGFMNTASSLAAVLLPVVAAGVESRSGSFQPVFAIAACVYLAGAFLWLRIDPSHRLEDHIHAA
jgi:MFS family permease